MGKIKTKDLEKMVYAAERGDVLGHFAHHLHQSDSNTLCAFLQHIGEGDAAEGLNVVLPVYLAGKEKAWRAGELRLTIDKILKAGPDWLGMDAEKIINAALNICDLGQIDIIPELLKTQPQEILSGVCSLLSTRAYLNWIAHPEVFLQVEAFWNKMHPQKTFDTEAFWSRAGQANVSFLRMAFERGKPSGDAALIGFANVLENNHEDRLELAMDLFEASGWGLGDVIEAALQGRMRDDGAGHLITGHLQFIKDFGPGPIKPSTVRDKAGRAFEMVLDMAEQKRFERQARVSSEHHSAFKAAMERIGRSDLAARWDKISISRAVEAQNQTAPPATLKKM